MKKIKIEFVPKKNYLCLLNDYKRNPNWKGCILEYKLACKNCDNSFCPIRDELSGYGVSVADTPALIKVFTPLGLDRHILLNHLCDGNKNIVSKVSLMPYEKKTKGRNY